MKNVFRSFVALAASLLAFSACQEIEDPVNTVETHKVRFLAGTPETRTSFSIDNSVVNYEWSATDATENSTGETKRPEKFQVFENGVPATSIDAQLIDGSMWIDAEFANSTATSFEYQAVFNAGVESEQSSSDESYDQYSDVLISNVLTDKDNLVFSFKREVAMAVVTLKGLEKGEYLYHVKIESNKPLAGTYNKDNNSWDNTSTTLDIDSFNEITDGVAKLYFITIPVEEAMLKVTVETTNDTDNVTATYVKEFTKSISFSRGNVRAFNANLEGCETVYSPVEHNISWTGSSEWASDIDNETFSLTTQPYGYSVILKKSSGSTSPTVNASANDCRLYAKGTATISNPRDITKIVFNISAQGKTRLAPITASVGTIATQAKGDDKVVWTGKAKEVTFTVGNQADYGSDGSAKAGQLDFSSIDATYLDDGTSDPEPEKPTEYHISVDSKIIGGTVSVDKEDAIAGTLITLSYEEADGYEFDSWNVTNTSNEPITVTDNMFTMPDANVNVSASFNAIPTRPENEIFYESFDTNNGTGGNDDQWSGTIASSDIKQDNEGWEFTSAKGANRCAKFGAGSTLGSATTPALGVACNATLTFGAAAWNGKDESTTLKLSVIGGGIISPETVTLKKGEWDTFTATLTGLTASSKVKFEGNAASNSRFFLDEVSIVKTGEPTATYTVTVDSNISNGSVTVSPTTALEGVTVTLSATPKEGYEFDSWIVTGVTLADETSETTTFTMPAANVTVSASFKEIVIPDKTIAEFIAAGGIECYLTGTVGNIVNTTYGNFYLTDESGTIYIYGCKTPAGVEKQFNTLGVEFGDKIKVHASEYELYEENTDEATNVVFVEIIKKATKYDVTVANSIANGTVTVNPTQAAEGQTVAISATPNSNYKLKDGSVKVTKASGGEVTVSDNKFTMPAEAVTVSAEFEESIATTAIVNISKWLSDNPDVTVSASSTVGSMVKSISIDSNITVTVAGNGNTGTFWGTSPNNDWRIYSKKGDEATVTITASNSKKIKSVKFAFSTSNGGGLKYNTTALTSGTAKSISPSGDSVTLSVPYSSGKTGQARITEIEIVYE